MPQEIELPKSVEEAIAQGWEYDCADSHYHEEAMAAVGIAVFKHPDHRGANEKDDLEFLAPFTCKYTYEAPRWKIPLEEQDRIYDRDPPGAPASTKP